MHIHAMSPNQTSLKLCIRGEGFFFWGGGEGGDEQILWHVTGISVSER
jgi:hypothetical protein